jgi:DNA-binding NarL/FixJ family response regulator
MSRTSQLRPSDAPVLPEATPLSGQFSPASVGRRQPRVFRNSYTRAGRRFVTSGWAVKLQHQGQRRTISLRAASKAAAAREAKAISDTLLAEGWESVLRGYPQGGRGESQPAKCDTAYWRDRLLVRRYPFPGAGGGASGLAVRIDHAGGGYWFPLDTTDHDTAAEQARQIYETVLQQGWEECCRQFPRELILGFEWCANPLLWTYTTIHTILAADHTPAQLITANPAPQPVLILERDAGVRRALAWCVNQHHGLRALTSDSMESLATIPAAHRPVLILTNRSFVERLEKTLSARVISHWNEVPVLPYSVAVDGDQLFVSTPGGATGYFLKRVRPERLLEPMLDAFGRFKLPGEEFLPHVKSYFHSTLRPRTGLASATVDRLTPRENEVLALLSKGRVDKEIAQALGISAWTVHGHIKRIFERLQVRTRTEAVVRHLEKQAGFYHHLSRDNH